MKKRLLTCLLILSFAGPIWAQETFPVNGLRDERPEIYAFTNATIFTDYQTKLDKATLVIQDEKILAVGTNANIPKGAVVYDMKGKYIYPSFIDLNTHYGMPEVKSGGGRNFFAQEQIPPETKGPYNANDAIKTTFSASEAFTVQEKDAKMHRNLGFGAVLTYRPDGVARGTSALVSLSDENENKVVLKDQVGAHYAFSKGSSGQMYPVSLMGYIALLRQTFLDAQWYEQTGKKEFLDLTLEAWNQQQNLPQFFEVRNYLDLLRADKVGDEFGVQYIIKTNGDEYKRIEEVKATQAALIVPLNFPNAYSVDDPYEAMRVPLEDMMHWEQAPANLARLAQNGIEFSITTDGLKKKTEFWQNLRKAIQHGLTEKDALKALTYTPAKLLKAESMVGSLAQGKYANFIVTSGNIFDKKSVIHTNWIQGKTFTVKPAPEQDYRGNYQLSVNNQKYRLEIGGDAYAPKLKVYMGEKKSLNTKGSIEEGLISLSFQADTSKKSKTGFTRLSGWITEKTMSGQGQLSDGTWTKWSASYTGAIKDKKSDQDDKSKGEEDEEEEQKSPQVGKVMYPFMAYGNQEMPQPQNVLFKNATVWTNEADGVMEGTDVLVKDGKIAQIGKNLNAGGAEVVNAEGKHLTSGIIDEHSHIALAAVNDVATNSAMVRMEDVVDPDDINIYRQLSGGVTAAQLLHGSANPIGGQSALVKMRWGASAEEMLIKEADGYIKFALGENVKRSRSSNSIRYPQTRMGVEQVYVDAFTQAKAYDADRKAGKPVRRDLALETLAEIINKERFITCHSYVQSEINMLMKVAEQFDFRVNTFTHILEGYKVADKMAKHGAGASTFADWWAYKFEVYEAIPYNPTLMTSQGVVTAINSDDSEMARRLNQEAAKSVKYGGMSEEEALKMVTLNPAKLLHLDDRMGSIKVGKDADLVLWSDHPLSIYAKAEKTMVDGIVYFDRQQDLAKRKAINTERNRLIQKMRKTKSNGAAAEAPSFNGNHSLHCDDFIFYNVLED